MRTKAYYKMRKEKDGDIPMSPYNVLDVRLVTYLINAENYNSVLKGVPFSEHNLHGAKWMTQKFHKCKLSDIRVKYRGKRTRNPNHTLKRDAHSFDVYVRNYD